MRPELSLDWLLGERVMCSLCTIPARWARGSFDTKWSRLGRAIGETTNVIAFIRDNSRDEELKSGTSSHGCDSIGISIWNW